MNNATQELIRKYYAAFNALDMDAFLGLLHEQVVHDLNQRERQVGREAFARFMQRMNRCYREQIVDLVVMTGEDGQRAAAEFVVLGEYLQTDEGLPAANGQKYQLPGGAFFDIADGKITRVTNYYNLQEWLRQVGAQKQD
ncbi:MAG TPA: ketosteroid isomerase-related protein [Burkholderiales bacterium]|nr:ketosteroid isomerase-related protein [Burkholderiales bacterium]